MDSTHADTGDDYSYDLAHEVPAGRARPTSRSGRRPGAPERTTRPDDGGDYSYDLAHEVPPPRRRE